MGAGVPGVCGGEGWEMEQGRRTPPLAQPGLSSGVQLDFQGHSTHGLKKGSLPTKAGELAPDSNFAV